MHEDVTIIKQKTISLSIALFALAFVVPLVFNGSQIVTGIIVNTLLFVAATRLSKKELILLAVMPSLGALSHGYLFGAFTIYLVYFLPFIWIGNYLLMRIRKTTNFFVAAIAKSAWLFLAAYVLVSLHIVPNIFLTAMGIMQLVTAMIGGVAARGISHERN